MQLLTSGRVGHDRWSHEHCLCHHYFSVGDVLLALGEVGGLTSGLVHPQPGLPRPLRVLICRWVCWEWIARLEGGPELVGLEFINTVSSSNQSLPPAHT